MDRNADAAGEGAASAYERIPERDLDSPRFDQPPLAADRERRRYLICTTPRSGSWLLCRQLANAGFGIPNEYFSDRHIKPLSQRWNFDPRDTRAYLHALYAHRTTPNGVWGAKLMWTQYTDHRNALKVDLFGRALLIFLYRDDAAAQAVSMHVSWLTGIWGFDAIPDTVPRNDIPWGDLAHIAATELEIHRSNRLWREFFASRRLKPLVVRYEDFVVDQPGGVARVARELGLAKSDFRIPPPEPRENAFAPDVEAARKLLLERYRASRREVAPAQGAAGP